MILKISNFPYTCTCYNSIQCRLRKVGFIGHVLTKFIVYIYFGITVGFIKNFTYCYRIRIVIIFIIRSKLVLSNAYFIVIVLSDT